MDVKIFESAKIICGFKNIRIRVDDALEGCTARLTGRFFIICAASSASLAGREPPPLPFSPNCVMKCGSTLSRRTEEVYLLFFFLMALNPQWNLHSANSCWREIASATHQVSPSYITGESEVFFCEKLLTQANLSC